MYVGESQVFYPPRSGTDRWPDRFYDSYGKNLKLLLCPSEITNTPASHGGGSAQTMRPTPRRVAISSTAGIGIILMTI